MHAKRSESPRRTLPATTDFWLSCWFSSADLRSATAAPMLVSSPARAALIGIGSIVFVAAPLGLAAGLWLLRRRRGRRAAPAGADLPVTTEPAEHSRT